MPAISSLLIVGAGLGVAVYTARSDKRRRTSILRSVAERRNGTLDPGGWFGNPLLEIRLHDGIELTVSMWSTKHGRYTEYNAVVPAPGLPDFTVVPTGVTHHVTKALGAQDIEVGVEPFDDAFVVKGTDVVVIRRIWSQPHLRDLALAFKKSRIECESSRIRLLQPVIESVDQVEMGIELLLDVARCDPYAMHVLGELPEASVHRTARGFVEVELPGPSRIVVGPVEREGVVRTCARTAALGSLPPDAETQVTALGATLEQSEHELRIWWPSVEADARRLAAAADLLRRLASGPQLGVFR